MNLPTKIGVCDRHLTGGGEISSKTVNRWDTPTKIDA